jgi:ABC-2 type transport system permease protein
MRLKLKLTIASLKMFYRQREAIIWTIAFPLLTVILFGFVRFDGIGRIHLGVVNLAGTAAEPFVDRLRSVRTFDLTQGERAGELAELEKGERDLVLILPADFSPGRGDTVEAFGDLEAKPRETQLAALVLQRVFDEVAFERAPAANRHLLNTRAVKTRNLTYMDFLLPGILAMSIMQAGIFGVAFSFVSLKKRGILRRLWVTPINPNDFIMAQVAMRLLVLIVQMAVMISVGVLFLHLHFIGNIFLIAVMGILGAIVFLGIGFTLAGISKSEDQVAPLANVISLPMMALSGVFFSRAALPGIVQTLTGVFPLTYLADGLRSVAIDGATIAQVLPQLGGLVVWSLLSCALAIKVFRWE